MPDMATDDDFDRASLPCFAHELALTGEGYVTFDPVAARDVARWRTAERKRLADARLPLSPDEAMRLAEGIAKGLDALIFQRSGLVLGIYDAQPGLPDLAAWFVAARDRGARIAIPTTAAPHDRPAFRETTVAGSAGTVTPDVIVVPALGYDRSCHVLGDGSGFYDRFLAAADPRPMTVAVGWPHAEVETVFAQPHDAPVDFVVTGRDRIMRRACSDG